MYFNFLKLIINHLLQRNQGRWNDVKARGGRFSWKGTFKLIYTKRCLQNIGSWTSPNHVFYWLDDRGVRGFSARRLCYSWSSMTAFLRFLKQNRKRIALTFLTIRYFAKDPLNWKGTFAPLAPPGKWQRGRLPLLPPSSGVPERNAYANLYTNVRVCSFYKCSSFKMRFHPCYL